MKNSPLLTALMVIVGFLTAVIVFLSVVYEFHVRKLRKLQPQVVNVQNNQNIINALANEALEYSKHNPSIDPILEPVGLKPGKTTSAAPAKQGTR